MQKNRTLQQIVPIHKTPVANTTNNSPTKHSPDPTGTQNKSNNTKPTSTNPIPRYPIGLKKTIDLENTFFIQEVFDSWKTVNFIKPKTFNNEQPSKRSPNLSNQIWIGTTSDRTEIDWLADTGSPRSFIGKEEADRILQQCGSSAKWKDPNECPAKYRCINNIEIPITGAIQLKLRSGNWQTPNNKILVVNSNTVKLLGRDVLGKLGFTLSQNKGININNIQPDNALQIRISKKFPQLCNLLGKSKNHIAKSTLKQDIGPYQHKGRRVQLHLTEKIDKEIRHLLDTNQLIKHEKCSDKNLYKPRSCYSKIWPIYQTSIRL